MIYLLAILAGIVGAAVGWFVTAAVTAWIAGMYGMSDFEGARGMFAAFAVGPIGGLVCMILSSWLVLRIGKGRTSLGAAIGRITLVLAGIAAVVGAAIGVRLLTIDTYTNELPPTLEFELRVPKAIAPADRSALQIELHTDRNVDDSYLSDPWRRDDGDHTLIAGGVPLSFKTSARLLVVSMPGEPVRLFRLPLSRNPGSTAELGEWRHADHIDRGGNEQPVSAPPGDPVELRYRVRRAGED
jgi:hypothetical protein